MNKVICLDIETTNGKGAGSLDPREPGSAVALIQLAHEDGQIELLRPTESVLTRIRRYIDEDYLVIIHNAAFELDWFHVKYGIEFKNVWCTMVASQILNAGKVIPDDASTASTRIATKNIDYLGFWETLVDEDNDFLTQKRAVRFAHNLQATVYRYANRAIIQKDQGNSDWTKEPLTPDQRRYAEDDVRYLKTVYETQRKFIERFGLDRVAELEMKLVIPVAAMKYTGMGIMKDEWLAEAQNYGVQASHLAEQLNLAFGTELAKQEGELSLFGDYTPRAFNVGSSAQLAKFFGLEKADEQSLRAIPHKLIPKLLEYKEMQKIASTYGEKYLAYVYPDGKLHSSLIQAETATGRFSSRSPNQQNVPADMLKSYIKASPGKLVVFFDYSSVESRILAYVAEDENFIRSVNSNDVHWENAKKIFHLPEDATRNGVFSVNGKSLSGDELRRKAKGVSFG